MARLMCIATHHKAGTIWMKRIVLRLAQALGLPWIGLWGPAQLAAIPATGRAFLCNWNSRFPRRLWARDDIAFVHLIRDPRDVLLSGMAYHRIAGPRGERFLHQPRADLDGKSYQQHLNALPDDTARLHFEMNGKHADTLRDMLGWPWGHPANHELRYESLMQDQDGTRFAAALAHWGLTPRDCALGRKLLVEGSLFGGLSRLENRDARLLQHVQSGGLRRWARELPRAVGAAYAERFGDALVTLGYERDRAWVDSLPLSAAEPGSTA
ncbi:MAG: hypothetical protein ACK4LQ_15540 [Pararhodobacter sp.]